MRLHLTSLWFREKPDTFSRKKERPTFLGRSEMMGLRVFTDVINFQSQRGTMLRIRSGRRWKKNKVHTLSREWSREWREMSPFAERIPIFSKSIFRVFVLRGYSPPAFIPMCNNFYTVGLKHSGWHFIENLKTTTYFKHVV